MNHTQSFLSVLAHIEAAMNTESTASELAMHVKREHVEFLQDAAAWLTEIVAARPAIQPAREWRSPTEVRRAVAARTGAAREFVGKPSRRRKPLPANTAEWMRR